MKLFKVTLGLFLFITIFSMTCSFAGTMPGWSPVTLGSYKKVYTSNSYRKIEDGKQYIYESSAVDQFNKGERDRAVEARTNLVELNLFSGWTDTVKGKNVSLSEGINADKNISSNFDYKIQLRAKRSTLATVDFYGYWYLDPSSIN